MLCLEMSLKKSRSYAAFKIAFVSSLEIPVRSTFTEKPPLRRPLIILDEESIEFLFSNKSLPSIVIP